MESSSHSLENSVLNGRSRYFTRKRSSEENNAVEILAKTVKKQINTSDGLTETSPDRAMRLGSDFFNQDSTTLAKLLLGKILVRQFVNGMKIWGRIVETEAYLGGEDKASHSFGNKQTERNTAMFMKAGTVYVYSIYGMYYCVNISSKEPGGAVLLRAIEPLGGLSHMEELRCKKQGVPRQFPPHQLCNGPSKICLAYDINKTFDKIDIATSDSIWIEDWNHNPLQLITSARIGMSKKAEEWMNAPLRFYIHGCKSVSVKDRVQEALVTSLDKV